MVTAFSVQRSDLQGLTNKHILITGGSSGIGAATAILFHDISETNKITIVDRQPPKKSSPLSSSPRVLFRQCDITKWSAQRAAFNAAINKFGTPDAVYVNAGIAEHGNQFFRDEFDADGELKEPNRITLDIDMYAANDTVKLALFHMRKAKKGGSIVITASLAGYLASAGAPLYSAAKHGIVGLMRALKNDTATLKIAISVVAPGITVTPILTGAKETGQSPEAWANNMQKVGVPINSADSIALAVGHLVNLGMQANGQGILIQADRMVDLERGIAKTRNVWMGEEMLNLFRGGRTAPLFGNKL